VWPFETGLSSAAFARSGPLIVHAEIWPGVVEARLDPTYAIRDEAQVRALVTWLAECDRNGQLEGLFAGPATLDETTRRCCVDEEGWIIGAGTTSSTRRGPVTRPASRSVDRPRPGRA
jgi:hypothetical protein